MMITEISQMSTVERIQTMEAIWESLTQDSSELESPEWHKDILSDRRIKIENNEAEFISINKLKSKHK